MRLKLVTTALLIFGLVLLVGWPIMARTRPPVLADARLAPSQVRQLPIERRREVQRHQREMASWTLKYALYFITTLVVFASTAVCAILVARQTRESFRSEVESNLRELIEGTLEDHGKKRS